MATPFVVEQAGVVTQSRNAGLRATLFPQRQKRRYLSRSRAGTGWPALVGPLDQVDQEQLSGAGAVRLREQQSIRGRREQRPDLEHVCEGGNALALDPAISRALEPVQVRAVTAIHDSDQRAAVVRNLRFIFICSGTDGRTDVAHGPRAIGAWRRHVDIALAEAAGPVGPEVETALPIGARQELRALRVDGLGQAPRLAPRADARAVDMPDVEILAARVVPHRNEVQPFAVRRHAGIAFLHAWRGERNGCRLRPCAVHALRPDQSIALEARIGLHEVHLASVRRERRRRFVLIARNRRGRPDAGEGGSGEEDLHAAAIASISSSHASS
jgi:hypothetical protein